MTFFKWDMRCCRQNSDIYQSGKRNKENLTYFDLFCFFASGQTEVSLTFETIISFMVLLPLLCKCWSDKKINPVIWWYDKNQSRAEIGWNDLTFKTCSCGRGRTFSEWVYLNHRRLNQDKPMWLLLFRPNVQFPARSRPRPLTGRLKPLRRKAFTRLALLLSQAVQQKHSLQCHFQLIMKGQEQIFDSNHNIRACNGMIQEHEKSTLKGLSWAEATTFLPWDDWPP